MKKWISLLLALCLALPGGSVRVLADEALPTAAEAAEEETAGEEEPALLLEEEAGDREDPAEEPETAPEEEVSDGQEEEKEAGEVPAEASEEEDPAGSLTEEETEEAGEPAGEEAEEPAPEESPVLGAGLLTAASNPATGTGSMDHYLVFASDRHEGTSHISTAMGGSQMPASVEYACLIGDMVNQKNAYNTSTILEEVQGVFPDLTARNTAIVYGSHDYGATDDAGIMKCAAAGTTAGTSQIIYTGYDGGEVSYYVYGIAFDDVVNDTSGGGGANRTYYDASRSQERARDFEEWTDGLDPEIPIIVACHAPLHAKRGDNPGAVFWNRALNYAATGSEEPGQNETVLRDVVFLHGHNHTTESREYYCEPGESLAVPTADKDKTGTSTPIYYTYITAGYLTSSQTATLIGIDSDTISFTKYTKGSPSLLGSRERAGEMEEGRLLSIDLDTTGTVTSYTTEDEALDLSGLVVTAHYYGKEDAEVTGYELDSSGVDLKRPGSYSVTVTYEEGGVSVQASFKVLVSSDCGTVFVRTDAPEDGALVVLAADGYLLGASGSQIMSGPMDPDEDGNLLRPEDPFIWTLEGTGTYTLKNAEGNYLAVTGSGGSRTLTLSGTATAWTWDGSRLFYVGTRNSYYLTLSDGTWSVSTSASSGAAFSFYQETSMTHTYGDPVWTWTEDHSGAGALFTCRYCGKEISADGTVSLEIGEEAEIYTARTDFGGRTYTDTVSVPHVCGEPVWTWSEDRSQASVLFICDSCGKEVTASGTVADASTDEEEIRTARAEFGGTTYTDTVTLSHAYEGPVWTWSDDHAQASALFTCESCGREASAAGTVTTESTDAEEIRTARAEFGGTAYTDTVTLSHAYEGPVWTWSDDHSQATALFACESCGHEAEVSAEVTKALADGFYRYTASAEFGGVTYTGQADLDARVVSALLRLEDSIGVKFRLSLKDTRDPAACRVLYTMDGSGTTELSMDSLERDDQGRYLVVVPVVAKRMTDEITIRVTDENGERISNSITYSVETYCRNKLASSDKADLKDLCASILNYGAFAQTYLDYQTGRLANRFLESYTDADGNPYSAAAPDVTVPASAVSSEGSLTGLAARAATLGLEDATVLNFYFSWDQSLDPDAYTFACGGETCVPETVTGSDGNPNLLIRIRGIAAKDMHQSFTVTASLEGEEPGLSVTYSVLTYLYNKQDSDNAALAGLCRAMYGYHLAARTYFGN